MLLDGFEVAALIDALGLYGALAERALLAGLGQTAQGGGRIGGQHANHVAEIAVHEGVTAALQVLVVGKDLLSAGDVGGCSGNLDGIGPQVDGHVQTIFQQAQVFVSGSKQGFDIWADFDILLHLGSEDSLQLCRGNRFAPTARGSGGLKHMVPKAGGQRADQPLRSDIGMQASAV